MTGFQELGVISELSRVLTAHGIFEPTPVQSQAIPVVLAGDDVLAQAQTGTGKTLAFVLPMLQKIDPSRPVVQGLILCPTRELALQVSEEIKKLLVLLKGINVLAVYGGQDVERQMRKLQGGVHLIVATPGRLLDHLRRGTVDLWDVKMLVLDEADQMLHMGFLPEVEAILREVAEDRQTMLFSATMPEQIRKLANKYLRMPVDVKIEAERLTVKDVRQLVIETTDRLKQDTLKILIEEYRPFLAIIFCRTKRRAQVLNEALQQAGYESDELHGDLSQAKREQVMKKFREAKIQLLVATDVAARGLDVSGVTHVFNYDIPHDLESYVHRIGRTGRAGERGIAITLASSRDREFLAMIEQGIEMEIERHMVQGVKIHRAPLENYSKDKPYGERRGRGGGDRDRRGGNDRDRKGGGDRDRRGGNDRDQKGGYGARGGNDRDQKGGYGARGGNDRDQKGGYGARGGNDRDQKGGYGARGGNDRDQKGGYGARGGNDRDQKGGYGARGGNDRDQKGGYGARGGNDRDQKGGYGARGGNDRDQKGGYGARGGNDRDQKGGYGARGGNDRDQKGGYGARGGNDRDQRGGYGARGGNDRDQKGGYGARGGNERDQKGGYGARGGNDRDQKGGYGARGGNDRDQRGGYGARGGNDRDQKGGYGARGGGGGRSGQRSRGR